MTIIIDMDLPDGVWQASRSARTLALRGLPLEKLSSDEVADAETAGFRAALQAMLDNGMASLAYGDIAGTPPCWTACSAWSETGNFPMAIIRLDNADELRLDRTVFNANSDEERK